MVGDAVNKLPVCCGETLCELAVNSARLPQTERPKPGNIRVMGTIPFNTLREKMIRK